MAEQGKKPGAPDDSAAAGGTAKGAGGPPELAHGEAPEQAAAPAGQSPETDSLLALIDKLTGMLERSDLVELEVQSGDTGIVLRKPAALRPAVTEVAVGAAPAEATPPVAPTDPAPVAPTTRVVRAPLTGIYYSSSSPSAPPYVTVGQPVTVGQVIGLIEAMKLFNEIKSDVSGRVVRMVAETGKLVKAKQPLIEVEP
jgi:acetyl-CoA carboxylase biotin carboxyl carrier protein